MKNLVATTDRLTDDKWIPNIGREHLDTIHDFIWQRVKPTPVIERVVVNHRSHMTTGPDELPPNGFR
jgi:hypothetical protein